MSNFSTNKFSVYIQTNTGNMDTLAAFGMEAGNTYDVSYYMNRISEMT